MGKRIAFIAIILLLLIGSAQAEESFIIKSLEVISEPPSVRILFQTNESPVIHLESPDGSLLDSKKVEGEEITLSLVTVPDETPVTGNYTLTVYRKEVNYRLIGKMYEDEFFVNGSDLKILGFELIWDHPPFINISHLREIKVKVKNEGAMTAHISNIIVDIDGSRKVAPTYSIISPGEKKSIETEAHGIFAATGEHTIRIILKDTLYKEIGSSSLKTVTVGGFSILSLIVSVGIIAVVLIAVVLAGFYLWRKYVKK